MADQKYLDYIIEQLKNILAIDSPTGYTKEAAAYIAKQYELLGFQPKITTKGSVLVDLGGEDKEDAHMLIKRELKANSPFAAFKRWIIRDNKENLGEFL